MSFIGRLFGRKNSPEHLTEERLIALLQEGKVGKTWHLVMRCYDEHNRTPADRKKALEDAYPAMLRLCDYDQFPGLLTSRTEVLVSNTGKESEGGLHYHDCPVCSRF